MKDINKVILIGRLGIDPTLKTTASGMSYARFSLATNKMIKDQSPITQWHRIVVWGKMAEHCSRYLKKGHHVYVEGELRSNEYEDKEGVLKQSFDVHINEISFLGYPKASTRQNTDLERNQELTVESQVLTEPAPVIQ